MTGLMGKTLLGLHSNKGDVLPAHKAKQLALFFVLIDLLENPTIDDVVVLSVVLEEVKNKNLVVYNRPRALCCNTLKRFFVFFNEHHKDTYVMDMAGESLNDRNAKVESYVKSLGQPAFLELLVHPNSSEDLRPSKKKAIYS